MLTLRKLNTAAASALLSAVVTGCASLPPQQVSVAGAVPADRSYMVTQPVKDAPALPALAGLESCLQAAGMHVGTPPQALVQAAYSLRPANALVLRAGQDAPARAKRTGNKRDREELVLTVTDAAAGNVLLRGAVARVLGKGEAAGDGTPLVAPLCAALTNPAVAARP